MLCSDQSMENKARFASLTRPIVKHEAKGVARKHKVSGKGEVTAPAKSDGFKVLPPGYPVACWFSPQPTRKLSLPAWVWPEELAFQGASVSLSISHADFSGLTPVCPESELGSLVSTVTAAVTKATATVRVYSPLSLHGCASVTARDIQELC
ncbi:hypothetical protein Anapl_02914 [Anas platyrhynchos]|uniref:Uncharacterized protein n=1 Tax=Anas platyrhynchos TaxID=8839 RepID=R0LEQ4_ANAPL|nr:hypothetical protein Anapl_02914 [Anas platyrhynchos]